VLPVIGVALTVVLWLDVRSEAMTSGPDLAGGRRHRAARDDAG
jgi:hypothetical protein